MASLIARVKSRLFIHAHRSVIHLLEGEYAARVRGRSLDFDDLRAYAPGDEVKDIDWKATARHGTPLVKRYVALRRQNIVFVVDTGRNMAARATASDSKSDVAVMAIGALGYLALRHGDEVSLVSGDANRQTYLRPRSSEGFLERLLRRVAATQTLDAGPSSIGAVLSHLARAVRGRHIVVVVTDEVDIDEGLSGLIKRVNAQHEVIWITIGDADLSAVNQTSSAKAPRYVDVADGWEIPTFVRGSAVLGAGLAREDAARRQCSADLFDRLGISAVRIDSEETVIPGIVRLLQTRAHA